MAKSRFEYVKSFERDEQILPDTYIVVRIDGRNFHRFSDDHQFLKPNDERALGLMNECALNVVKGHSGDISMAYGQSDEYSFVIKKSSRLFQRRCQKLVSTITSLFSSSYVFYWQIFFPDVQLQYPPSFDGRVICYPTDKHLRDYLSWRQADCHINNLYNTCFWSLVQQGGKSKIEAEKELCGTSSSDKNELLFSLFSINYNNLSPMFRKGSIIAKVHCSNFECRDEIEDRKQNENRISNNLEENHENKQTNYGIISNDINDGEFNEAHQDFSAINTKNSSKIEKEIRVMYVDIIGNSFWNEFSYLLK